MIDHTKNIELAADQYAFWKQEDLVCRTLFSREKFFLSVQNLKEAIEAGVCEKQKMQPGVVYTKAAGSSVNPRRQDSAQAVMNYCPAKDRTVL